MSYVPRSYAATLRLASQRTTPTLLQAQYSLSESHAMGNGNTPTSSRQSSAKPQKSFKSPTSRASSVSHTARQRPFVMKSSWASRPQPRRSNQAEPERVSFGDDLSKQQASIVATNDRNRGFDGSTRVTPALFSSPDNPDANTNNDEVSQHEEVSTFAATPETPLSLREPEPISLTEAEYDDYARRELRQLREAKESDGGLTLRKP
jgi:hypothetical protein